MLSITKKRLNNFQSNRRGFVSLCLFMALMILTSLADFIANEQPLLVYYDQKLYCPILKDYAETEFGGELETRAQYGDEYVQSLIKAKGWMVWPLIPYSLDTIVYDLEAPAPSSPTWQNKLGTDDQGRDVLTRLLYGLRVSIWFGVLLTAASVLIGATIGALQGYFGGMIDLLGQRFVELWSGLPVLFILIVLASIVEPNVILLFCVMLLFSWMSLSQVVRTESLRTRNFEYIKAAKMLGISNRKIIISHLLPNSMVAALTAVPFMISGSIATLTALDFLGFGLPPGAASLGEMLAQGKNNLHAPWLGLTAFMAIAGLLSILVFIGEAVRDAFDPRKIQG